MTPSWLKARMLSALLMCLSAAHGDDQPAPLYAADLHWTDDRGQAVKLSDWRGKTVIMTMAFSTCRKFCPIAIARLARLQTRFDEQHIDAEFIVISYDPATDNWRSWADYRASHKLQRPNWHFLTGSLEDTKTVSRLLGMDYWLYDDHVLHNFKILRVGVNGQIEKSIDWDSKEELDQLSPN